MANNTSIDNRLLKNITHDLLIWFGVNKRNFSWRQTKEPYYVLISEILLRKTGAVEVERMIQNIFIRLPSMDSLLQVSESELADVLSPLGLQFQRSKQLKHLAHYVRDQFNGIIPQSLKELQQLPGVGKYTAAMIASTCYGILAPAVDTNVARIVTRVFSIVPSHAEARKSRNIWELDLTLLGSNKEAGIKVTWALLDLAASVCTISNPNHEICPLLKYCRYAKKTEHSIP